MGRAKTDSVVANTEKLGFGRWMIEQQCPTAACNSVGSLCLACMVEDRQVRQAPAAVALER